MTKFHNYSTLGADIVGVTYVLMYGRTGVTLSALATVMAGAWWRLYNKKEQMTTSFKAFIGPLNHSTLTVSINNKTNTCLYKYKYFYLECSEFNVHL